MEFYFTVALVLVFAGMAVSNFEDCECSLLKRLLKFETDLDDVKTKFKSGEHIGHPVKGGASYIRWGRSTCPGNGTDIVYSGYIGGSNYDEIGAASNYLCLPKDPQWDKYDDSLTSGGRLYGGEYEFAHHKPKSVSFFGKDFLQQSPACSLCLTRRHVVVMIPARTTCYQGWTKEYSGYLTSGAESHKAASEFICLDRQPEITSDERKSENGKVLYLVEGVCGSLPCPPYVNGREITCVVCTK